MSLAKKVSTGSADATSENEGPINLEKEKHRISPLLQVISQSYGAQTFYGSVAAYFLLIILVKCILFVFSSEERMSIISFYGNELRPIGYFVQLFLAHHVIFYSFVYPTAKFVKSGLLVTMLTLLNVALFKLAMYHLVYIHNDTSVAIRVASALENVRFLMKTVSLSVEVHSLHKRKGATDEVTLCNATYFLFAPTLIYRVSYEKTNKPINWRAFLRFFTEFQIITIIWCLYIKDFLVPALENHRKVLQENPDAATTSYIRMYIHHVAHSILMFLWAAFGFLHSYCNATAELLCFADRTFYHDWWITGGSAEMLRKWNRIVGIWLVEYIYLKLLKRGVNRVAAMICVLLFSGLYHDYVVGIISRQWIPGFTVLMAFTVIAHIITPHTKKLGYIWTGLLSSLFAYCSWSSIAIFSFT